MSYKEIALLKAHYKFNALAGHVVELMVSEDLDSKGFGGRMLCGRDVDSGHLYILAWEVIKPMEEGIHEPLD